MTEFLACLCCFGFLFLMVLFEILISCICDFIIKTKRFDKLKSKLGIRCPCNFITIPVYIDDKKVSESKINLDEDFLFRINK